MLHYLIDTRGGLALLVLWVSGCVALAVGGCGEPGPAPRSSSERLNLETVTAAFTTTSATPSPGMTTSATASPITTTTIIASPVTTASSTPSQVATVTTPRLRSGTIIMTPSFQGTAPPSAWYTSTPPPPGVTITVRNPPIGPLPPLPTHDPRTPTYPPFNPPTIIWGGAEKPPTPAVAPFVLTIAAQLNGTPTPTP